MVAGGEDGRRGGERAVRKFSIAATWLIGSTMAIYLGIYLLPFFDINWIPPFGPMPCSAIPVLNTVEEKWNRPEFRREILDQARAGGAVYEENDIIRNGYPNFGFGEIIKYEAMRRFGKTPSRVQFREGMASLGLKCGKENVFPSSKDVPFVSSQIDCTRNVPRGCPSRFGHWPYLFPSIQLSASATFRSKEHEANYTSYAAGSPSAL